jgi:hypothetical protein
MVYIATATAFAREKIMPIEPPNSGPINQNKDRLLKNSNERNKKILPKLLLII